ncbi:hypothetical protein IKS57_04875 [bacterium]|nr:hypothetical protein [bacterium]
MNNIIEVSDYSAITASNSLSTTSNQNNLIVAILQEIYKEISKSFSSIVINNTFYDLNDIVYGGG